MNRTNALALATRAVSLWGRGTDWTVSAPWKSTDIHGPSTEIACDSYPKARQTAARNRARIALALLGQYNDDTCYAVERGTGSARDLLRDALDSTRDERWMAQGTRRNVDGKPDYPWTLRYANGRPFLYASEEAAYRAAARACADTAHGLHSPRATRA